MGWYAVAREDGVSQKQGRRINLDWITPLPGVIVLLRRIRRRDTAGKRASFVTIMVSFPKCGNYLGWLHSTAVSEKHIKWLISGHYCVPDYEPAVKIGVVKRRSGIPRMIVRTGSTDRVLGLDCLKPTLEHYTGVTSAFYVAAQLFRVERELYHQKRRGRLQRDQKGIGRVRKIVQEFFAKERATV